MDAGRSLIIGGGIGGLCTAIALRRVGIVEIRPSPLQLINIMIFKLLIFNDR
jgi:hypothetical protein